MTLAPDPQSPLRPAHRPLPAPAPGVPRGAVRPLTECRRWRAANAPDGHGDVGRGGRPPRGPVGPQGPVVRPPRLDPPDLAQFAAVDQPPEGADGRVVLHQM